MELTTYLTLLGLWQRRDHRYTLNKHGLTRAMAHAAYVYRSGEANALEENHPTVQRELGLFAARWGL